MYGAEVYQRKKQNFIFRIFFINPLVVTICPETFSNLCVYRNGCVKISKKIKDRKNKK
jgi:hypothetical protein